MPDARAAQNAALTSLEWKDEWTTAIWNLEQALEALDRIGASLPALHLSYALELLRVWSPEGERPNLPPSA